ncbi:MAG TPA: hypothetical protein VGL94_20625 [Ktedonobacteraceae bacterium]|jgi:hypothetical protein
MFQNTPTSSHQENVPPSQPEGAGKPSLSLPLELLEESMTPLPQYSHGAWGWWLRMTAPPQPQSHLDARMREQLRRSRLLSLFLLVLLGTIVVLFPKGFIPELDPSLFGALSVCSAIVIGSILLNRYGLMNAAASVLVVGIAAAIAFSLLATPNGLGMQDLPTFDMFVIPIILAGILLPKHTPFLIWSGCILFIVLDLTFETHQQNLDEYIQQVGLYATIILPAVSTFTLAVASWLSAGSVERALREADRTKELEKAYQLITEQKKRLEEGIAIIQAVHSRVANGDLQARASITSGELLPLAVGLNLMLDRLARSLAAEHRLDNFEQGIHRLNEAVFAFGQGQFRKAIPLHEAGRLEPLAISLEQLRQRLVDTFNRGSILIREITALSSALLAALQQQDAYLQAAHHERFQLRSACTHIKNVQEEINTQYRLFDHMVRIQQNSGTVTLRPVDTLSLLRVLQAKAKELDDSETLLKGVEDQITKLVTLTGAPNGYEERQDQRKTIERRLYNTTEHLEQLFAHFVV